MIKGVKRMYPFRTSSNSFTKEITVKRLFAVILSAAMIFSLYACGSKTYQVKTKSGESFNSLGAPDYDVKSKSYKFTNEMGKEVILNKEDIDSIKEK